MQERRYDVDWLRIIAILAVFLYHCTRFFGPEGWHLKNPEQSELLLAPRLGLVWAWAMELFFLLSGVGTWYALRSRASQAASHPSVYRGSLCSAADPALLRTVYQFGVSRQLLAIHPALLRRLHATPYNAVARYAIAHSFVRAFVVSPVSLSNFAHEPPTAALFEIRTGATPGRETCRMV